MIKRLRNHPVWRHLQDRPFATALGALLVVSPIITALHAGLTADVLEKLVPMWIFWALLAAYFASGVMLVLGIAYMRLDWEAAGCALALSGLLVRLIALLLVIGPTVAVIATGAFYVIFAGACVERLLQCLKGEHIVRVAAVVRMEDIDDERK